MPLKWILQSKQKLRVTQKTWDRKCRCAGKNLFVVLFYACKQKVKQKKGEIKGFLFLLLSKQCNSWFEWLLQYTFEFLFKFNSKHLYFLDFFNNNKKLTSCLRQCVWRTLTANTCTRAKSDPPALRNAHLWLISLPTRLTVYQWFLWVHQISP